VMTQEERQRDGAGHGSGGGRAGREERRWIRDG
jgi:hypothetical protein